MHLPKSSIRTAVGALLLFLILALPACSSTTVVARRATKQPSATQHHIAADYSTAMADLDFHFLERNQVNQAQRQYGRALQAIAGGEYDSAEVLLTSLLAHLSDSVLARRAGELALSLLSGRGKWRSVSNVESLLHLRKPDRSSLTSAFAAAPAPQCKYANDSVILPIEFKRGLPVVDVTINGIHERFIFDTGASETVIASDVADRCGIMPASPDTIRGRSATTMDLVSLPSLVGNLELGGHRLVNHPAFIVDKGLLSYSLLWLLPILKVDGIIGWRAMRDFDITLDYRSHSIVLKRPLTKSSAQRNLLWFGRLPFARFHTDTGDPLLFLIDAGANRSSLTDYVYAKLRDPETGFTFTQAWSAGGSAFSVPKTIHELTCYASTGSITFRNIVVRPLADPPLITYHGVLGSDFLKQAKVHIDFQSGTFEFEPYSM